LPLRVVAKDSGVIAYPDDFVSPIGVYADCGAGSADAVLEGRSADRVHGWFVQAGEERRHRAPGQREDANADNYPPAAARDRHHRAVYQCVSTGRWEANLRDTVRNLVKE
jgi:hypothetical protein